MRKLHIGIYFMLIAAMLCIAPVHGFAHEAEAKEEVDIPSVIFGHIGDAYEWHITDFGKHSIAVHLPIIVYSKFSGWHVFSSKKVEHSDYNGFYIASTGEKYEGKIVERLSDGSVRRPFDISITKNVLAIMFSAVLLVLLSLGSAKWYRKKEAMETAPKGLAAFTEPIIMMVHDIAKTNIPNDYRRFSPYLCTAFFFIFLNNILGILPFIPGGANVTGNIAVTFVLALFTFLAVNLFGSKHYYKEIFWPDVPWFLKAPIPVIQIIELFSALMKPISLTIRLFANILAGHILILSLVCVIFVVGKYGSVLIGSMSVVSVAFGVFMDMIELLVAFIQAYVFTMLSAIFIGLARSEHA